MDSLGSTASNITFKGLLSMKFDNKTGRPIKYKSLQPKTKMDLPKRKTDSSSLDTRMDYLCFEYYNNSEKPELQAEAEEYEGPHYDFSDPFKSLLLDDASREIARRIFIILDKLDTKSVRRMNIYAMDSTSVISRKEDIELSIAEFDLLIHRIYRIIFMHGFQPVITYKPRRMYFEW